VIHCEPGGIREPGCTSNACTIGRVVRVDHGLHPFPPPDVLFLLQREVEVFRVLGDGGEDIAEVLFAPCPVVDSPR